MGPDGGTLMPRPERPNEVKGPKGRLALFNAPDKLFKRTSEEQYIRFTSNRPARIKTCRTSVEIIWFF